MISGKDIFSKGACGVAVCRYPAQKPFGISLDYGALEPLGDALEVTVSVAFDRGDFCRGRYLSAEATFSPCTRYSAKGNIILELAGTNATRLLLERIQQGFGEVISKEQGFYMGILPEGKVSMACRSESRLRIDVCAIQSESSLASMVAVRPILAGDPSRGALSLDTEANITPGQYVQFFHTPATSSADSRKRLTAALTSANLFGPGHLVFQSDASGGTGLSVENTKEAVQPSARIDNSSAGFFAASEHGYIVGRPGEASWICSVQSSTGAVEL